MTDYDAILNDDSINCVVELMGGVTDAKDVSGVGSAASRAFLSARGHVMYFYVECRS